MLARRILTSLLFNVVIALWVWHDARRRGARKPPFAAAMALFFGPLGAAFYVADRPLVAGEQRNGGFAWQMAQGFIAAWTAFLPSIALLARRGGPVHVIEPGFGIVQFTSVHAGVVLAIWLAPVAIAWALGWGMRRPAEEHQGELAARGPGVPFLAALVVAGLIAAAAAVW